MRYQCGHDGCDICGVRALECDPEGQRLTRVGTLGKGWMVVCDGCLRTAVDFAIRAAETFAGIMIDPARPCGRLPRAEGGGE